MTVSRLVLPGHENASDRVAARVLDLRGEVVALVYDPLAHGDAAAFRDAVLDAVRQQDFGEIVLAGVAFEDQWGGDAVGFT
jgi:hypothetical protein